MAKPRHTHLRIVTNITPSETQKGRTEIITARPTVRAGGLFSETTLPIVEEDAIRDPDTFFTFPALVSLLHEQIEFGNLHRISVRTGIDPEDIKMLLKRVTHRDHVKLLKIRIVLGLH